MTVTTWILAAEGSRARLFELPTPMSELVELEGFSHPEGHLKRQERYSDAPGKFASRKSARTNGVTGGAHAFMKDGGDREMHEAFARFLAEQLEHAYMEKLFDRLVIMAPPALLGMLRDRLDQNTQAVVAQEVPKNLARHKKDQIREHVAFRLAPH